MPWRLKSLPYESHDMADSPQEFTDFLFDFAAGVNAGIAPLLLPRNQLANGLNTTVRGTFVKPRPPFVKLSLDVASEALLASGLSSGAYQGGCFFQPDNAEEGLMMQIGGRLFQITPSDTSAIVVERTI